MLLHVEVRATVFAIISAYNCVAKQYLSSYFLKVADEESTLDQRSLSRHTCSWHTPPPRCQETELLLCLFAENEGRCYHAIATQIFSFVENEGDVNK